MRDAADAAHQEKGGHWPPHDRPSTSASQQSAQTLAKLRVRDPALGLATQSEALAAMRGSGSSVRGQAGVAPQVRRMIQP